MSTRRRAVTGLVIVIAAAVLVAAGCLGVLEAGIPLGGISRSQAIAIAENRGFLPSDRQLSWAIPGPFTVFQGGGTSEVVPPYHLVWAVTFSGTFAPASCGPFVPGKAPQCPPPNHTETVVLDYFDGTFIMAHSP